MSLEDDDVSDVVRDAPSESRAEAGIADIARVGQEKPQDQKDKEDAQAEMRRLGKTPSSKDLPQVDWSFTDDGNLVIQFQDKLLFKQVPQDDPIMAKDLAASKLPENDSSQIAGAVEQNVSKLLSDVSAGDLSNSVGSRTFDTREDGAMKYTVKDGDNLTRIAEDSLKEQHKDDPNYKPEPEEVKRQIDAIARANKIDDPNLIHTGDELVIPSHDGHVVRDPAGAVTEVQHPDGSSTKIEYDGWEPKSIKNSSGSHWEKEGDGWVHYGRNGAPDGLEADKVEVSNDGDINVKLKNSKQELTYHPDGSVSDKDYDGSVVTRDDQHRVTEIKYPDNSSRTVEYGGNGELKAINSSDGTSWKKEGDHFTQYKGDQKTGAQADDIGVTPSGDVRLLMHDSDQEIILNRDGSRTEKGPDHSAVTSDTQGHVTKIDYPDGKTTTAEYDGDQLKAVKQPNGLSWEKNGDTWVQKRDGKETGVEAESTNIDANGDIKFKLKDSDQEMTLHRDGSLTEKLKDNSELTTDRNDQVVKVQYPDGTSSTIKNDAQGHPIEVRSDNFTWKKEGDQWTQYNNDGHGTGLHMKDIEVSKNGSITYEDKNGDGVTISRSGDTTPFHVTYDQGQPGKSSLNKQELNDDSAKTPSGSADKAGDSKADAGAKDASGDAKPADAGSGAQKGDAAVKGDNLPKVREGVTTVDRPAEPDPAKLKEIHDDPKVKAERDALEKDIKNLPPEQQERMRQNMEKFEKRAALQDPPMKPEEVAKTLREIKLLAETPDRPDQPLNKAERINIADQVLKHAADPTSIDQGNNNTCNVTTVEARMFTKEPSKAAEMIRELSINGSYVSHGKPEVTVELDRNKLKAGAEESNNPPKDGDRSHASKVFQEGAIALSHERHGVTVRDDNGKVVKEYPPGSVEYRKGEPTSGSKPPNDSGEQLIDKKTGQPIKDSGGKDIHGPGLDDDHIVDTYNDITGADPPERGMYIVDKNYVAGDGKKVEKVSSEEDLKKELEKAKGPPSHFPIIVGVNTAQEPFFTDSNGGAAGGSGGGHVVTITDYDPRTGEIKMDNQWGKSSDHTISVHDLHVAMKNPADAIKELEKDVAKNRADGVVDRGKELELLRLKHNTGQMSDAEYDKHVIFVAQQAVKEAQKNGGYFDKQTQQELQGALKSIHDGKNGETRMQEVRKGLDGDIVNRIEKQGSNFVGDIKLPDNYATKDMEAEADKIHDAKGILNDDEEAVYKALANKSPEEIKQMEDAFQKKYGVSMETYMMSFMDEGKEQDKVRALLAKAHGTPIPDSPAPVPGVTPPTGGPPPKGDAGGGGDARSFASLPQGALADNIGGGAFKGDSGPKGGGGDAKGDSKPDAGTDTKPKEAGDAKLSPESENVMKHLKDSKVPMSPEKEAQMRKDLADIDKLPPEQRKKVLESIDKIATTDTKLTKPEDRAELAASLAHQIAHPESIKQGQKETCVAGNIEKTMATTHPDQYADMVAQLATKGEYTTPPGRDGKTTTIKAQLDADGTLADKSDPTGVRSATSELMQTAIINLTMNDGERYMSVPPTVKGPNGTDIPNPALQPTPKSLELKPSEEEGERVVRKVFDPEATRLGVKDGTEIKEPFSGLSPDAKERILGKLCPADGYEGRLIHNTDDLGKAWKDNGGKPPLNVGVRMDAPFLEKGSQAAGTHALTITHIDFGPDGKPTKVYYDNPAGGPDHSYPNGKPVPADEFVKAMQSKGRSVNADGQVESWDQPLRATVRTDNQPDRQEKTLDKAADDFHNAKTKDEMLAVLKGKTRAEIKEMDRIHRDKYGRGLSDDADAVLIGAHKSEIPDVQQALKGTDTSTAFDPRRPPGIGDFSAKELKRLEEDDGDVRGLDWRKTEKTTNNPDGSVTKEFKGEIEDGWWDNGFKASETRDQDGNLIASRVTYDSPINQKFVTPQGEVEIKDIKTVETKRDANGNDVTTVTGKDGKTHTFVTDPKRNSVVSFT